MAELTIWQKFSAARLMLSKTMPYLESAVVSLVPVEAPGMARAAGGGIGVTPEMQLVFDPSYVMARSHKELAADLAHEVSHIMRKSFARTEKLVGFSTRTKNVTDEQRELLHLSNLASDFPINADLREAGMEISSSDPDLACVFAKDFGLPEGKTHEEYYYLLLEKRPPPHSPRCGRGQCGSGAGLAVEGEPKPSSQGEESAGSGSGEGKDKTTAGRTASEVEKIRQQVAEAVQQHLAKGTSAGKVPAGWKVWAAEQLTPPKVRWQDKLRRVVGHAATFMAGAADFRFVGVSRRQAGVGFGPDRAVFPKLWAKEPVVELVVDTSGSMGRSDYKKALSEADGILQHIGGGVRVSVVCIDADVQDVRTVKSVKEIDLKGGGGTVFTAYFDLLVRRKKKPGLVVFFTDGDAWGIPKDCPIPKCKFIWILTRGERSMPFGEVVCLED